MKIRTKLILFISILLFFPIIFFFIGQYLHSVRKNAYRKDLLTQKQYSTNVAVKLSAEVFKNTAETYTFWDELITEGVQKKNQSWYKMYFDPLHYVQGIEQIWICDMNLNISLHSFDSTKFDIPFPLTKNIFYQHIDSTENSQKRYFQYFVNVQNQIFQVFCMTIHRTEDTKKLKKPEGVFIITNHLDSTYFSKLKIITNSNVESQKTKNIDESELLHQLIVFETLHNAANQPVAYLKFWNNDSFQHDEEYFYFLSTIIFLLIFFFIIFLLYFFTQRNISQPLSLLIKVLKTNNLIFLDSLTKKKNEFSKLSNLMTEYFRESNDWKMKNSELKERNEEINQQTEEIRTIVDNLTEINEKILTMNEELSMANGEIDKKNQNIQKSLRYALKIQHATLPSANILYQYFPESFIFFKPKDIVSGDFYYFKKLNDILIVAAADCTGHGVPGGLMSMLGVTFLNEIVNRREIICAAEALNVLRDEIKQTMSQTNELRDQLDGMDIAFCALNLNNLEINFAGANNSLWIFRNDAITFNETLSDGIVKNFNFIEIPADKMPVGIFLKEKSFTKHSFQLEKNDIFYLFSDGFHSQLNKESSLPLTKRIFRKILSEIYTLPVSKQQEILEKKFNEWKKDKEQTDDILIIGVKV